MKAISEEMRDALDHHLAEAYLLLAEPFPGVQMLRADQYSMVTSSLQHPIGNFAIGFRFSGPDEAKREIEKLLETYHAAGSKARFWLTGREFPSTCPKILRSIGMIEAFTLDQMAMHLPIATGPGCGMPGQCASTPEEAQELAEFWIEQFFHKSDLFVREQLVPIMAAATEKLIREDLGVAYYYRECDRIVCAALLLRSDKVAGIYSVATCRDHRGRGLATAATRMLMSVASEAGCEVATLQAADGPKRLYQRLGFRSFSPLRCFIE